MLRFQGFGVSGFQGLEFSVQDLGFRVVLWVRNKGSVVCQLPSTRTEQGYA